MTNFPYVGFLRRALGSDHSKIVVVPVTLDDSQGYLTAESNEKLLRTWVDIVRANAENGAITCLLLHPTDVTYKLETERRLIEAVRGDDAWVGDVGALSRFWQARARLHPVIKVKSGGKHMIILGMKLADLPAGQALIMETGPGLDIPTVQDAVGVTVPVRIRAGKGGSVLLLR